MFNKRCAICKVPAAATTVVGVREKNWLCPACRERFNSGEFTPPVDSPGGEPCRKCKKVRNGSCRFSSAEKRRITACSDWEGKDTKHNQERWAKFE